MFTFATKLTTDLIKWGEKKRQDHLKAATLALSKASYWLMTKAKYDLKTGRLGLRRLSYLSDQSDPRLKKARYRKNVRRRTIAASAPLTSLFKGITYRVDRANLSAEVGFRGVGGTAWAARIAEKSLSGYRWRYTPEMRAALHKVGIHLRPTTSFGRVPSRDAMGKVQVEYERAFFAKLQSLYVRKMSGERI